MTSNHNSTASKVLKIHNNLGGVSYFRLASDWGTEYSLTECAASDDAVEARYLDPIELDGKSYTLIRFRGAWDVVRSGEWASMLD